jgi:hypothetical protein
MPCLSRYMHHRIVRTCWKLVTPWSSRPNEVYYPSGHPLKLASIEALVGQDVLSVRAVVTNTNTILAPTLFHGLARSSPLLPGPVQRQNIKPLHVLQLNSLGLVVSFTNYTSHRHFLAISIVTMSMPHTLLRILFFLQERST